MNLLNELEMKLKEYMTQCLPNLTTKLQDAATYALLYLTAQIKELLKNIATLPNRHA